jgi:hypothetical protein
MERSSMFVTCAGEWNEDTMKWDPADATEAVSCCIDQCMGPVNFCYDYCKSNRKSESEMSKYRCSQMCEDQRKICIDTCSLISKHVGKDNAYVHCATKNGCSNPEVSHDVDCLLEHNDTILQCCRKSCTTSNEVDCDKNCDYLHSVYTNPPTSLIPPDKKIKLAELLSKDATNTGSEGEKWPICNPILLFITIIAFLFLFLFIVISKKKEKLIFSLNETV